MKNRIFFSILLILFSIPLIIQAQGDVIHRKAKNTVTPIEMNQGDTLKFKLRNGDVRTLVLKKTDVNVVITNLSELKKNQPGGATLYQITSTVVIDGHSMKMVRYVGSQESFYEPYVINGMRIWFDGVSDISKILRNIHGDGGCGCLPNKDARFAITDMTDSVAPIELSPWYVNKENFIDIADSYNGDDPWMGPYNGYQIHGGLDINMPPGTPNFTPFPIDDHYFFNSLEKGHNNNRWRGTHQWENGDIWTIQNHHMLNLKIPEHTPIEKGVNYAAAAGVHSGSHHHSHYVFKTQTPEDEQEILLDPWIIFWQTFENNKERSGDINATISPLTPHMTGQPVIFNGEGSRSSIDRSDSDLSYYWTFGDGGWSNEANPEYTYTKPGIYPVTLVVDDGARKDSFTQHITIDGEKVDKPALSLRAKDEPSFRIRSAHIMDVYGKPVQYIPHSLQFLARETRPKPSKKIIEIENNGGGVLSNIQEPNVLYFGPSTGKKWVSIEKEGKGNSQKLIVGVNATGLSPGVYSAKVQIESPEAVNNEQGFLVQLTIPTHPPAHGETRDLEQEVIHHSDTRYNRFYSTPYFWVGPQFHRWQEKGYEDYYLTNGGRAVEGEFARFTPDLEAGRYEVSFTAETPFDPERRAMSSEGQQPVNSELNPDPRFAVRVHSKGGDQVVWMEPLESKVIGTFEFYEGMDGYVEILAGGSTGQVLVDAIVFDKIE